MRLKVHSDLVIIIKSNPKFLSWFYIVPFYFFKQIITQFSYRILWHFLTLPNKILTFQFLLLLNIHFVKAVLTSCIIQFSQLKILLYNSYGYLAIYMCIMYITVMYFLLQPHVLMTVSWKKKSKNKHVRRALPSLVSAIKGLGKAC